MTSTETKDRISQIVQSVADDHPDYDDAVSVITDMRKKDFEIWRLFTEGALVHLIRRHVRLNAKHTRDGIIKASTARISYNSSTPQDATQASTDRISSNSSTPQDATQNRDRLLSAVRYKWMMYPLPVDAQGRGGKLLGEATRHDLLASAEHYLKPGKDMITKGLLLKTMAVDMEGRRGTVKSVFTEEKIDALHDLIRENVHKEEVFHV